MQESKETVEVPQNATIIDEREIPSDPALVTPLVVRLVQRLEAEGLIDKSKVNKTKLCLDEAITNAVVHGNQSDFSKLVHIWLFSDESSWGILIKDEGKGFDFKKVSERKPEENLWDENGRGLPLLDLYMDECSYYDGGATLLLRQYLLHK
ncbi:MAG: ATP-binding protein [Planctomycetota bacterium]